MSGHHSQRRFLFICTGNVCRSLMAERILRQEAARRRLHWEARSCGVAAELYYKVPKPTLDALAERGVTDVKHTPQLVSAALLEWADVALAMTREQLAFLHDRFPQFRRKTHLLNAYAGLGQTDVADPMGQPPAAHTARRDEIARAIEAIIHATQHLENARP